MKFLSLKNAIFALFLLTLTIHAGKPEFSTAVKHKTGISVPIVFKSDTAQWKPGKIGAIGVFQDEEKYIFALHIPEMQQQFSYALYWNTDNNAETGRFPKSLGVDLQLNVNPFKKTVAGILWMDSSRRRTITLYDDDYLLERDGDIFFLAIRAKAVHQSQMASTSAVEVKIFPLQGDTLDVRDFKISSACKSEYIVRPFPFLRLESRQSVRHKPIAAEFLKAVPAGTKVWDCMNERFEEHEKTPEKGDYAEYFTLQAARGEMEHLFLAIESDEPIQDMAVNVSDWRLENGSEIISGSMTNVYFADYVRNDRGDSFTDVLLPNFPGRETKRQFVVWSLTVPRTAKPGNYQGESRILLNGKKVIDVPMKLTVFNFEMPEKALLTTAYGIKGSHVSGRFKNPAVADIVYRGLLEQCRELRYGPRLFGVEPKCQLDADGNLQLDWSPMDSVLADYYKDFPCGQITPAQAGSHDAFIRWNNLLKKNYPNCENQEFQKVWRQFVTQYAEHFKKLGYFERTQFIIWDEPYEDSWNNIKILARIARECVPDLKISLFVDKFVPELDEFIDIWIVPQSGITSLSNGIASAKKKWIYNSGYMDNFLGGAMDMRGFYLQAYRYGIGGLEFSAINYLQQTEYKEGRFYNYYPQHCWMYVSNDGKKLYKSWRQLIVQSGLDDYDYVSLYTRHNGGTLPQWVADFLPELGKDGNVINHLDTVRQWEKIRQRIGQEIK